VQANKTTSSLSHTPKQASAIVVLAYAAGHKQASHKKSAGKQDGRLKQAMALHGSRRDASRSSSSVRGWCAVAPSADKIST
jgi:hypothetical protein